MVELTRVYHFSAAHQLVNPALSPEQNAALYGDCHGPHGHNYYLEVTMAGQPDPVTGMAAGPGRDREAPRARLEGAALPHVRLRQGREGGPERRHVRRGLRRDGDREGHRLFQPVRAE